MGEWEKRGESDEWYTPPEIFRAIGLRFALDVASPGAHHWVPADSVLTKSDDGLRSHWNGLVWMNPPFGGRNGQVPWLEKFIRHGNGIGLVAARTSSKWFQDLIPKCDAVLFPRGKTKFIKPSGEVGKSPGSGVVLVAMGLVASKALEQSQLGMFVELRSSQKSELREQIEAELAKTNKGRYRTLCDDDRTEGFVLGLEHVLELIEASAVLSEHKRKGDK